jgi:hypothetical protein
VDFHDFLNDALHGPSTPATVSFTIQWGGTITARHNVKDASNGFAGEYAYTTATMVWSANEPSRPNTKLQPWGGPATYVSDPARTSTSDVAVVGHERNGVFFS